MISKKQLESIISSNQRKFAKSTFWLNSGGNLIYVGEQLAQLSGYRPEELLQEHISILAPSFEVEAYLSPEKNSSSTIGLTAAFYTKDQQKFAASIQLTCETLNGDRILVAQVAELVRDNKAESVAMAEIQMLKEQNELLLFLIDEVPSPLVVKNYAGKFVLTNKAVAELYCAATPASMLGKDDGDYIPDKKIAEFFRENVRQIMDEGKTRTVFEDSIDVNTGERRNFMSIKKPYINQRGEKQILVIANDITPIRKAQKTLMQYEKIMSVSHDFLSYEDTEYRYQAVNDAYLNAFQLPREDIIGESSRTLLGEEFFDGVLKPHFDQALQGREASHETWINFPALGRRFVDVSYRPYRPENRSEIEGVVTRIIDITERYEAQEKLRHLADHDILTGLPNRRMFSERLTQALSRGKRHNRLVAVFFIDLDRFKVINDSLGHSVGDRVLQAISTRLQRRIRMTDTLARSGGDEFLLLLEDFSSINDVTVVCNSFLDELTKPILLEGHELFVTASIGVSMYPSDATNGEELIQSADAAMYKSKKLGRNTYQLSNEELRVQASERFSLERNLRSALENNEFTLYFQPQIEMNTLNIIGTEALLRWQHPQQGFIPPATFIPVAEDCGVIIPLGEWVLESACRQMAEWVRNGCQLERISVNISGNQLLQANFTDMVKKCLFVSQLAATHLELEITESYLMSDTKMAATQLAELRYMGVSVAIDDFGTGHSSLRYLQELPISKLKIDRSFVQHIPEDKGDCAIVKTIIDLANNLGISVIAEGVEEIKQEDFLLAEGCRFAQGFKYGRPVAKAEFEKLLMR
jgi:diguanylate cyclase (GGDEF)-like protein/PAS domain S-box-containing protein